MRRRFRQIKTEDGYKLVEVTGSRGAGAPTVIVQRDLNFKSIVDGSEITTHAQLAEHNKRNNVVHESEFGSEAERESFFARKAAERADLYQGTTHTAYGRKLRRERIEHIKEAIDRHER